METGVRSAEQHSVEAHGAAEPRRWWILAAVGVGTVMGPLDGSIVNIALPTIASEFHSTLTAVEWVVMNYLLAVSTTLLIYGRMGDLYGQRRLYVTGFVIFVIGSLACSLSPGLAYLVGFRVVQALGAGMMIAMGPAIITRIFPASERGRALGINSMVVAVGLVAGPTLGGFLVEGIGWRSIFWINVPIGLLAIAWAIRVIPEGGGESNGHFDLRGALFLFLFLLSLLLIASEGQAWGWGSARVWAMGVTAVVAGALFLWTEMRVEAPMVDLTLFRNRVFVSAAFSCLLNFIAQFSVTFLIPFYLEDAMEFTARDAGLILTTVPAVLMVAAPVSGALSDKFGSSVFSPLGMAITTFGLWLLSRLTTESTPLEMVACLLVFGLGAGLFGAPNNSALMGSAPPERAGMASGVLALMRNSGMVLGIAISGAIVNARLPVYMGEERASLSGISAVDPEAFVHAQHDALLAGTALAALGIVTSLVRAKRGAPPASKAQRSFE